MADVAAAAGVSRATVYRHFPTREALLRAIRAQALEQSERALVDCRLERRRGHRGAAPPRRGVAGRRRALRVRRSSSASPAPDARGSAARTGAACSASR